LVEVVKFHVHQKPHHNEQPSSLPPFEGVEPKQVGSTSIQGAKQVQPRLQALRSESLLSDSPSLTADSLNHDAPNGAIATSSPVSTEQARDNSYARLESDNGSPVVRLFEHWKTAHRHPKAQLDDKRRKIIALALKHYSEADLIRAIDGYKNSPHHMGKDPKGNGTKYDDIELFLRDGKHIDAGLAFAERGAVEQASERTKRIIDQTANWRPPEMRRVQQ
jgi:hypothetical protein